MPGYLSHLAARVIGSKSGVHPRVPSMFEPARGVASFGNADRGIRIVEEERIALPMRVPTAVTPFPIAPPLLVTPAEGLVESQRLAATRQVPRNVQEAETDISSALPASTRRSKLRSESDDVPPTELRTEERIAVRPEVLSTERTEKPRHSQAIPVPRVPEPLPELPRIFRSETPELERSRVDREESRKEVQQPLPELASLFHRPIVQPVVQLATQPEHRLVQSAPESGKSDLHEPPAVQVTIGRLIVEAVAPTLAAAPQPSPRIPAPHLSLDDYLRQRRSQV